MTTKNIITLAMLAVTMASCSQKQQEEKTTAIITSTTEKNDTVIKEFVKENLYWTREPKQYVITDSLITIETEPNTDLWQRTYYGFSNDNAPVLQMKTSCQYFSFTVKTEFNSSALFDQCGIAIYLDSDNWMKASIEYEKKVYRRNTFHQMRAFHLFKGDGEISFGIYAASPVDHSFTARFSNMEMGECKWESWSAEETGFNQTESK